MITEVIITVKPITQFVINWGLIGGALVVALPTALSIMPSLVLDGVINDDEVDKKINHN